MTRASPRHLVVVPMKDPSEAKTRLSDVLDPSRRAVLATRLFTQTLHRLSAVQALVRHGFDVATVTASPVIATLAKSAGVAVIEEAQPAGLNAAVSHAAALAAVRGYRALTVLPGDLADPTLGDLQLLLDRAPSGDEVVICASTDGGTNALMLPLPAMIRFSYGTGSFRAHAQAAHAAGVRVITPRLDSLRHDVDQRETLQRFPFLWPEQQPNEVRP